MSSPDPPYITRLLLADGEQLARVVCEECQQRQARAMATQTPARALHIMNELVTPDVEYANWKEFAELVYSVQDSYCECLRIALHKALARDHLNSGHIC
jgi:hypothetical protein